MITHIDVTNYRCFENISIHTNDIVVFAGANGAGKSTLLDVPVLLGDLLRGRDLSRAFMDPIRGHGPRASTLGELRFRQKGESFSTRERMKAVLR